MTAGESRRERSLLGAAPSARPDEYLERQRERFRRVNRAQVATAFAVMSAALVTNGAYYVVTRDAPNRDLLWLLQAFAVMMGIVATRPPRWIRADRTRRSILLHSWALSQFVLIGLAAMLDGGLGSPLMLLMFFTMSVAAIGFSQRSVWLHISTSIAIVFAVGVVTGTLTVGLGLLWSSSLLTTALTGSSIARRQRGLVQELSGANAELNRIARTDPLTGCLNRRGFYEELEAELQRHDRDGTPLVLVMLDLDEFKQVNDQHGHPVGDEVLVAVADVLRSAVRAGDVIARSGGEEFAVLMPNTPAVPAEPIAERLRQVVATARCSVPVTASAGLAAVPDHATTAVEVVRVADRAMYAAKHAGRDRLVVAS